MVGRLYIHTSCVQVSSSQPRQQRRCAPLFQRSGMEVVVKRSLRCKTLGKWDINGICAINQHHSIWRQKNKLKWSFIRLEIFDFDFRGGFEDTSPNIILHILPFSIPLGSQQQNAASCPRPDSYHHSEEPSCHLLHCGERREPSFHRGCHYNCLWCEADIPGYLLEIPWGFQEKCLAFSNTHFWYMKPILSRITPEGAARP